MIPFPAWEPDRYDLGDLSVSNEMRGVLPGPTSKLPWPSLTGVGETLASECRGAAIFRQTSGTFVIYAGTETKLYRFDGTGTGWTDVTRSSGGDYSVPSGERWNFTQFGPRAIAVNSGDAPQYIDVNSGTNFAALGGSPPNARVVQTVGDQVWLGGLANNPNRVFFSGRNNSDYWTTGQNDCDFNDFPDGGWVLGITPLETGLVFQEGAVRRFQPVKSRAIFEFGRVEDSRGLLAPDSLVVIGRVAYYLSEDGFYATDGAGNSRSIGANRVDKWFQELSNYERSFEVQGVADPARNRVFWLFAATSGTIFDYILCYDVSLDQWGYTQLNTQYVFGAATTGYTLEDMDALLTSLGVTIETADFSFDARWLKGGAPALTAFDSTNDLAFFSGSAQAAIMDSATFEAIPGQRAFVRGVRPLTDAANATVTMGTTERPQTPVTFGSASSINAQGYAPLRSSGRFHKMRVSIPAGEAWEHARGGVIDAVPDGMR